MDSSVCTLILLDLHTHRLVTAMPISRHLSLMLRKTHSGIQNGCLHMKLVVVTGLV